MKPIQFTCREIIDLPANEIAGQILDMDKWLEFRGFAMIPAIKSARFAVRTPNVIGSRIEVVNRDGSSHVEEILEWLPDQRVRLSMSDFSRPLSRLATHFEETWEFLAVGDAAEGKTDAARSMHLHAKNHAARVLLLLIAPFLKRAIQRHMRQIRDAAANSTLPAPHR